VTLVVARVQLLQEKRHRKLGEATMGGKAGPQRGGYHVLGDDECVVLGRVEVDGKVAGEHLESLFDERAETESLTDQAYTVEAHQQIPRVLLAVHGLDEAVDKVRRVLVVYYPVY